MLLLAITIPITCRSSYNIRRRYHVLIELCYFSDQDAPHSLGGELGTQFSWWVVYRVSYIISPICFSFQGTMIMFRLCGCTRVGYRKVLSTLPVLTMQHTWCVEPTDLESSL